MCRLCPSALSRRGFARQVFAAAIAAPGCADLLPDSIVEPVMRLVPPSDAPPTVALTLDACSGATDMRIIAAVIEAGVKVTIFATGLWLAANSTASALLRDRPDLFSVQNHGARHLPPVLGARHVYGLPVAGTLAAIDAEVAGGVAAIAACGLPRPRWYRGAAAVYSPSAIALIRQSGVEIAGFSLNGDAGASLPAAAVARRIGAAQSGDVILAHVNQPHRPSGAGVAEGVTVLRRSGMVFVWLDAVPTTPLACAGRPL